MRAALKMSLKLTPLPSLLFLFIISGVVAQPNCSVDYTQTYICALRASTVIMGCNYTQNLINSTVQRAFWSKILVTDRDPPDLSVDPRYTNRVQYIRATPHDCSLRLRDVTQEDQGMYYFTFITSAGERFQGKGVELSVTGLRVEIPERVFEGDEVTLSCKTHCSLTDTPIFTWYRNGHKLSPQSSNEFHLRGASQHDSGDYRCGVQEQVHRSPLVILDVQNRFRVLPVVVGVVLSGVAALLVGLFCIRRWRRRQNSSNHVNAEEDTYIPPDPISRTSNDTYSTLENVYSSPTDDTYTAIDPQTRSSNDVYNTLATAHLRPPDDTYTALNSLSNSSEYYNLPMARNQE